MSDRMIEALAGEPVETLPSYLHDYFEEMCDEYERANTSPEPIHIDYARFEDFHGHDRADERRWHEAEMEMDPYEWINEETGSST